MGIKHLNVIQEKDNEYQHRTAEWEDCSVWKITQQKRIEGFPSRHHKQFRGDCPVKRTAQMQYWESW